MRGSSSGVIHAFDQSKKGSHTQKTTPQRIALFPVREPSFFTPAWPLRWLDSSTAEAALELITEEQEFVSLFFHGLGTDRQVSWDFLEIGLVGQQRTLLFDSALLDSSFLLHDYMTDALARTSVQVLVSDVLKNCVELLRFELTPKNIIDVQLRAAHMFPYLRNVSFFELCEQLLGVYIAPFVYNPDTWSERPLGAQHLRQVGTGAELSHLLYRFISEQLNTGQHRQPGGLTAEHLSVVK